MLFPRMQESSRYRTMTTIFGGYNRQISLSEGEFFDMKNMTSKYFPVLSPRQRRGIIKKFENPQGILDKEDLWWVDNKKLYKNGEEILLDNVSINLSKPKVMAKMGAYIVIMPDKIWIKTSNETSKIECGYMDNKYSIVSGEDVQFSICGTKGESITWQDSSYYDEVAPKDGDYAMSVDAEGKPSLKVYSEASKIWMTVTSAYMQIKKEGIGKGFEKGDGVKLTSDYVEGSLGNIFVNDEGDGKHFSVNTYIIDCTDDTVTIPGLYSEKVETLSEISLRIERVVPDMEFITECNNRLWGCSKNGHEIYCCKLGDVKNWNCFRGNSTDSWAATIGSDGKFTGAITFLGYPIFFKEDSLIKIGVSAVGAHQIKETICRGVQNGSDRSLAILNETLYYKSSSGVCGYDGSLPYSISDKLGDIKYYDAVAGAMINKYYISMRNSEGEYSMFVYDTQNGIWCKEDNTESFMFCKHKDELYYIDHKDYQMKSLYGTLLFEYPEKGIEDQLEWYVESGPIGYTSPDNKYLGRISMRLTLEFGAEVNLYMQYDSCGEWEHIINIAGTGTRSYAIPIIPKRCDHFKYKIIGKGECKIHSITKTIEEGSDI